MNAEIMLVCARSPRDYVAMEEVLTSTWFRYVAFPLGSAALGVAVKYVTRNDQYAKFQKEDMFIGLELILTACCPASAFARQIGVNEKWRISSSS
jgi:hypothetical protein